MEVDIGAKERINMLAPIDTIFGTHKGRLGPVMMFLGVSVAPVLLYLFVIMPMLPFIPLKTVIVFEVLWVARMALKILGNEDKKLAEYRTSKKNKYASAKSLIKIAHCYDTGLLEYENGRVSIVITGFTRTYFNDNLFSAELKTFFEMLDAYMPDVYLHQVVGEHDLHDNSDKLRIYSDKELMSQRMELYLFNDEYVNNNSKLWRMSLTIKTYKHNWKTTFEEVEAIINSDTAKRVFFSIEIASQEMVSNITSRDICTYVSIKDMLREKYANSDYDGSKVLYYGDDIPDEFKEDEKKDDMDYRRVIYEKESDSEE